LTYLVLTVIAAALSLLGMAFVGATATRAARIAAAGVLTALHAMAVVARLFEGDVDTDHRPLLVLYSAVLAICGGSLATTAVFDIVDRADMRAAADVLRGGIWIGALERLAVFGSLVAGLPEGLAVVLAVKALGRYPELRIDAARTTDKSGVGERFIIGTMISLLWAAAAAYVGLGAGQP
jgi:hypothetical protein